MTRVVYSIGRYERQARRICDAVIAELRRRGWLVQLRTWEDDDDAIADCDLFHGHSVLSLDALRRLRERRPETRIVLQRDSAHIACPAYRDEIARRRGGRWRELCATVSANVQPERIPAQREEYDLADVVLVPSRYVARTFVDQGHPPERLAVIPFTADAELFRPPAETPPFRVVLGGRATLTKGYPYAAEACERIGEPLDVLEGFPFERMPAELGRRTVCLAPSITDGAPHQVLAAMACALVPVVSTDNGCSELIEHGSNGFVVELRDPDPVAEIAAILRRLRADPVAMRTIGRRARATVAARTWVDYGRDVCDFYRRLLASPRRTSDVSAEGLLCGRS